MTDLPARSEQSPAETSDGVFPSLCPNCGANLHGQFCAACGQNQQLPDRAFTTILVEFLEDVFTRDSRAARTLLYLFFRPGYLALEYFRGRRARYVHPFRLYLVTSITFFFVLSVQSLLLEPEDLGTQVVLEDGTPVAEADADAAGNDDNNVNIDFGEINFDFLTEEENRSLQESLERQSEKAEERFREDPASIISEITGMIPQIMFFLLPVFAAAMKLAYMGRGIYYTEHLVLALHNHSFMFLALLISEFLEALLAAGFGTVVVDPLNTALSIWIIVYIYIAMKVYYQQSYLVTAFKFLLLLGIYSVLFLSGLIFVFGWEVMTL